MISLVPVPTLIFVNSSKTLRPYKCKMCKFWHLTHQYNSNYNPEKEYDKAFCSVACAYMNKNKDECNDCDFFCDYKDCYVQMIENIVSRITNLRSKN